MAYGVLSASRIGTVRGPSACLRPQLSLPQFHKTTRQQRTVGFVVIGPSGINNSNQRAKAKAMGGGNAKTRANVVEMDWIRLFVVGGFAAAGRNVAVVAARPHTATGRPRIVWLYGWTPRAFFCPSFGCSLVVFLVCLSNRIGGANLVINHPHGHTSRSGRARTQDAQFNQTSPFRPVPVHAPAPELNQTKP